jgi:catechol 2,3-dioxygenase-like lactoylglutathione lyase family enzyme
MMDNLSIDHIVLTVSNIDKTCEFYSTVMDMEVISFNNGRKALKFGIQKINLHEKGNEFDPKAAVPMPGSADICFITKTPIEEVIKKIEDNGINILEGPILRTGAAGPINSIYIRDPDGNLIEISNKAE